MCSSTALCSRDSVPTSVSKSSPFDIWISMLYVYTSKARSFKSRQMWNEVQAQKWWMKRKLFGRLFSFSTSVVQFRFDCVRLASISQPVQSLWRNAWHRHAVLSMNARDSHHLAKWWITGDGDNVASFHVTHDEKGHKRLQPSKGLTIFNPCLSHWFS